MSNRVISSILFAGSLLLFSCSHQAPPPHTAVPVNLYTVESQTVVYFDRFPGTTTALSQVNLLPQVPGYITTIDFKEGSHVKKGQLLYDIDKRLYEAAVQQAQANLKVAQDNLLQAQQDADRYTYLNKTDAVAKQTYDHAMVTLKVSQDQVKSAEEAVQTAQTNLAYSTITAPFDGTIGFSMVKLGDYVSVGQTILNTVSTDDPMGVDFLITEKQLPHYEDIQNGTIKPIDSLFTIILPNNKLYSAEGKISVIDRAVDPQTGSIRVRIVFPNPKYYLRAGMSCVVKVHNQDSTPQMVIPSRAVVEQMGEFFIFQARDTTIADTSKEHKNQPNVASLYAFQKKVQLGATIGPNVIVKSGIKEGDKIVLDGVQSLHSGSQITASSKPAGSGKDSASHASPTPKKQS